MNRAKSSGVSNLRLQVVKTLGGACRECGWAGDPRVMKVHSELGPAPKGMDHSLWLHQALMKGQGYYLLCSNCHFTEMYEALDRARQRDGGQGEGGVVVWRTSFKPGEVRDCRLPWVDKHRELGRDVFAVLEAVGGLCWRYVGSGKWEQVAEGWEELAAGEGLDAGALPGVNSVSEVMERKGE